MPFYKITDTVNGKSRRCTLEARDKNHAQERYVDACEVRFLPTGTIRIEETEAPKVVPVFVNPIALDCMDLYGGSFVKALAAAWRLADEGNSQKLAHAFPAILECYTLKADHLASRHAMRDTVSGEAALQAQLNQERAA